MKKFCIVCTVIFSDLLLLSVFPLGFWLVLFAPDLNSVKYYADDRNYVSFECSVQSFDIYEDAIVIIFNHSQEDFYNSFQISGKNFDLALEKGLPNILKENETFTITSANAYLGDGWIYPIVGLIHNGQVIIPYEEGKQNYVEVRQQAEDFAKFYIFTFAVLFKIILSLDVCSAAGIFLTKKNRGLPI